MSASVRDLDSTEMIAVSAQWLGALKPTFLAIPEISPLYTRMEADHEALVSCRTGSTPDTKGKALSEEAEGLDDRHDYLMRGAYYLLLASQHIHLGLNPADERAAANAERARDALFPNQLSVLVASYQAEAGNAAQVVRVADNDFSDILKAILVKSDLSALDVFHEIGKVGAALGEVERKKSEVSAGNTTGPATPAETRRRMRAWATTVEAILTNLNISSAPEETVNAIREPILAAAEKASARRRAKRLRGKDEEDDTNKK